VNFVAQFTDIYVNISQRKINVDYFRCII